MTKKILLAHTDQTVLRSIPDLLAEHGYQVRVTSTSSQTLNTAETWRPEARHDRQSVVHDGRKLIRTLGDAPTVELYDLRADPDEQHDLGGRSDVARRLLLALEDRMALARKRSVVATEGELSEEDLERLRGLGYVR